jgi:DNA-binding MarR family transcriptional regulator
MKIEEEIQQSKFSNEFHKASLNLLYTSSWWSNKINTLFKSFHISNPQYNVLRILKGQHPKAISTSDIKLRMLDKSSDVSRIVDRLFAKQLVIKDTCPEDRRLVDIRISDGGLALLDSMQALVDQVSENLGSLSTKEAKQLNSLLDKVRDSI